jgi:hypothetical protein
MKIWNRLTEQERAALPDEERSKVKAGIPCPWCSELIESLWTKHVYIIHGTKKFSPQTGNVIVENPYGLDGMYALCPHCQKDFSLKPGNYNGSL